jgi:hypothetical protein
MSNETNPKARPTHRIYSVTKDTEGKSLWNEIGAGWSHKDGKGLNLKFTATPADGASVVIRVAEPKKAVAA